jgi:hypothetical protein
MPLKMRYPVSITQTVEINLSEPLNISPDRGSFSDEAVKFDYNYSVNRNVIKLEYSLKTFADSVPVDKVQQHLLVLDRILNHVGFVLTKGPGEVGAFQGDPVPLARASDVLAGLVLLLIVAGVAVFLIIRKLKGRKPTKFAGQLKPKVGTTPETAIRLTSQSEIDSLLRNFTCTCSSHPYKPESPPLHERFTYDGRLLISLRLHCDRCLKNNDLYVDLGTVQAGNLTPLQTDQ